MPLNRTFRCLAGLLILCTALLLVRGAVTEWVAFQSAVRSLHGVHDLRLALVAAEMVSRERGPANGMLGDGAPPQPQRRLALTEARARTDSAFGALQGVLATTNQDPRAQRAAAQFQAAQLALVQARTDIDRLAARPRPKREPEALRAAVQGMVAVVPRLAPALSLLADNAQRDLPDVANEVQGARLVAELREYAGLLGSHFTAALTRQQALTADELRAIDHTRGRIDELRTLVDLQVQASETDLATVQAWQTVQALYFGQAQPLAERLIAAGQTHAHYDMDPAEFAGRYVPDMNTLFALRDALLAQAGALATEQRLSAGLTLVLFAAVAGLVLVLMAALVLARRRATVA